MRRLRLVWDAGSVDHEAIGLNERKVMIDRWYSIVRCQGDELIPARTEERIAADQQRAVFTLRQG